MASSNGVKENSCFFIIVTCLIVLECVVLSVVNVNEDFV